MLNAKQAKTHAHKRRWTIEQRCCFKRHYFIHHLKNFSSGATGYFVEYAGSAIRNLSMEARMTICNMSIEMGARGGMIAPDETTFNYIKGRQFAPAK